MATAENSNTVAYTGPTLDFLRGLLCLVYFSRDFSIHVTSVVVAAALKTTTSSKNRQHCGTVAVRRDLHLHLQLVPSTATMNSLYTSGVRQTNSLQADMERLRNGDTSSALLGEYPSRSRNTLIRIFIILI